MIPTAFDAMQVVPRTNKLSRVSYVIDEGEMQLLEVLEGWAAGQGGQCWRHGMAWQYFRAQGGLHISDSWAHYVSRRVPGHTLIDRRSRCVCGRGWAPHARAGGPWARPLSLTRIWLS